MNDNGITIPSFLTPKAETRPEETPKSEKRLRAEREYDFWLSEVRETRNHPMTSPARIYAGEMLNKATAALRMPASEAFVALPADPSEHEDKMHERRTRGAGFLSGVDHSEHVRTAVMAEATSDQ